MWHGWVWNEWRWEAGEARVMSELRAYESSPFDVIGLEQFVDQGDLEVLPVRDAIDNLLFGFSR